MTSIYGCRRPIGPPKTIIGEVPRKMEAVFRPWTPPKYG